MFVDDFLSAFIVLVFQPVFSEEFEEVFMTFFDFPELACLWISELFATDEGDFFEEFEHAFPHFL